MPTFLRVMRVLAIVWALAAVIGMGQAIKPSVDGASMLADWARSAGWLVGAQHVGTGAETDESMKALLWKSIGQVLFYFGWIAALVMTKARRKRGSMDMERFTAHAGVR